MIIPQASAGVFPLDQMWCLTNSITTVNRRKQMSRTVSARIPKQLHEDLRERCNEMGESINDFVKASIELMLYGSSDFDFEESKDDE